MYFASQHVLRNDEVVLRNSGILATVSRAVQEGYIKVANVLGRMESYVCVKYGVMRSMRLRDHRPGSCMCVLINCVVRLPTLGLFKVL